MNVSASLMTQASGEADRDSEVTAKLPVTGNFAEGNFDARKFRRGKHKFLSKI